MKRLAYALKILCSLVVVLCTGCSSQAPSAPSVPDDQETRVSIVASDASQVLPDAVWCAPLQICWDNIAAELNGGEQPTLIVSTSLAEELNRAHFKGSMLGDDHYYCYSGPQTYAAKQEIETALHNTFNQTSDILDDLTWADNDEDALLLFYTMLFRKFSFVSEFEDLEPGTFGSNEHNNLQDNVAYFGIEESGEILSQVLPLYYLDEDHFAAEIWTKEGDVLILVKSPEGESFDEMWEHAQALSAAQTDQLELLSFACPNLAINLFRDFSELQGTEMLMSSGDTFAVASAMQTVQLTLDRTGGTIKSEAAISLEATSAMSVEPLYVDMRFNDEFVLFVVDGNAEGEFYPYLGVHVTHVDAFQA